MEFALSDEQDALAAAERAWLSRHDPLVARRSTIDDGPARISPADRAHLSESALAELLTDEMGGTHVDLAVLVEEHGRAGSAIPVAELAVAAGILDRLGRTASVADSSALPALAATENARLRADVDGPALRLSGTTAPVTGLPDADRLVIVAALSTGAEVIAEVPVDAVVAIPLQTLDLTRAWSEVHIDLTVASGNWQPVPTGTVDLVRDELATFRCIDALGAAARLLDMTVDHAKTRVQFGSPIAGFQAIKHHCATMTVAIESSRAALWAAAVALDGDPDTRTRAVSAAAAFAGEATSTVAQTALQVHGGIGFTWEHDLHLLLRRIKVDELLDGSVSYHRRRLAGA